MFITADGSLSTFRELPTAVNNSSSLSVGEASHAPCTTNRKCAKNSTYIWVVWSVCFGMSTVCDFYCCLLCRSNSPIAIQSRQVKVTSWVAMILYAKGTNLLDKQNKSKIKKLTRKSIIETLTYKKIVFFCSEWKYVKHWVLYLLQGNTVHFEIVSNSTMFGTGECYQYYLLWSCRDWN